MLKFKANADRSGTERYLTPPKVPSPTWEYAVIHVDPGFGLESLRDWLDQLGACGWELCERRDQGIGFVHGDSAWALIFKRRTG